MSGHCRRVAWARIGEPARRHAARRDDPDKAGAFAVRAASAQRQQSRRRRRDQCVVVERAIGARDGVEPLVGCAERMRQRREIGLLGDRVGANEHAVGADAERLRPAFRGGGDAVGQDMANAVDFRAGTRTHGDKRGMLPLRQVRPQRSAIEPNICPGAGNGRPNNFPQRHRWPPDATQGRRRPPRLFPASQLSGPRQASPTKVKSFRLNSPADRDRCNLE
jgi:hypothetical protein